MDEMVDETITTIMLQLGPSQALLAHDLDEVGGHQSSKELGNPSIEKRGFIRPLFNCVDKKQLFTTAIVLYSILGEGDIF